MCHMRRRIHVSRVWRCSSERHQKASRVCMYIYTHKHTFTHVHTQQQERTSDIPMNVPIPLIVNKHLPSRAAVSLTYSLIEPMISLTLR